MLAHIQPVTVAVGPDVLVTGAAVLATGLGVLVFAVILADRRGLLPWAEVPFGRWVAVVVAALSLGAAFIHLAVIDAHFEEYPPFGVAFIGLACFQVSWAIAYLAGPRRRAAIAAIAVNAGALMVWLASRAVGLPFGPDAGQAEPVGSLDLAAGAMELALIGVLSWHLGAIGMRVRPALPRAGAAIVLGSSTLAVVLLTTAAFVMAGSDPHDGPAHAPTIAGAEPQASPAPTSRPPTPAPIGDFLEPRNSLPASGPSVPAAEPTPSPSLSPSPVEPAASLAAPPPTASAAPPPTASAAPSRLAGPTPGRATPAPTRRPTPTQPPATTPPAAASPGDIRFGRSLDEGGEIATPTNQFGEGQRAVWIADFSEAPGVSMVRLFIVQVLPDGREFEHWREDIAIADPASRRLVGGADLSVFLHGGAGRHVMRYMRGDALLAEGVFEFVR